MKSGKRGKQAKQISKPLLVVTIDIPNWLRGDSDSSVLLDHEGARCCLGFVGERVGFSDAELLGRTSPAKIESNRDNWDKVGLLKLPNRRQDSQICHDLMRVNDAPIAWSQEAERFLPLHSRGTTFTLRSEEERMALLRDLGKYAGIQFRFVNRTR